MSSIAVGDVVIDAIFVDLPEIQHGVRDGIAAGVQHAAAHDHFLSAVARLAKVHS
jgi:hypothetical protein